MLFISSVKSKKYNPFNQYRLWKNEKKVIINKISQNLSSSNALPQLLSQAPLILTLGIEFGKIGYGNITEPVKYAGTGKVIRVG